MSGARSCEARPACGDSRSNSLLAVEVAGIAGAAKDKSLGDVSITKRGPRGGEGTHVASVDGHADYAGDVLLGGDEGNLDKLALGGKI
jgi:hypothetical protein